MDLLGDRVCVGLLFFEKKEKNISMHDERDII